MKKTSLLLLFLLPVLLTISGQGISGTVVNDSCQAVPFANLLLFNVKDTAYVTGTATDALGLFTLPVEKGNYLMRVTSLGYDTLTAKVSAPTTGFSLRLTSNTMALKEVTVRGRKPISYMQGNALVTNVAGTTLSNLGTLNDVLRFIPMVWNSGSGFEVVGKGAPIYYINRRLVRDPNELDRLSSQNIQRIEVVHHPGARYGKSVNAVIIIHTKKRTGDGLSLILENLLQVNHYTTDEAQTEVYYRKGKFEISTLVKGSTYKDKDFQIMDQTVFTDTIWNLVERKNSYDKGKTLNVRLRVNYDINAHHSLGAYYSFRTYKLDYHRPIVNDVMANDLPYDIINTKEDQTTQTLPYHYFSSYYNGSIGKLNIDFNLDGLFHHNTSESEQDERAINTSSRLIRTNNTSDSHLWAERLVLTLPLQNGNVSIGNESSITSRDNKSMITGTNIGDSESHVYGKNAAFFAEFTQKWKKISCNVGLRFEHTSTKYTLQENKTLVFNDVFPSLTFSYNPKDNISLSFSYRGFRSLPTYQQLNSNMQYVNRFNISVGNPLLQPSSTRNASFNLWCRFFYLNINYTHKANMVTLVSLPTVDDDATTLFTYDNSGKKDQVQFSAGIQKQVSFLMFNYQASLYKQWYKNIFRGEPMSFNKPSFSLNCNTAATWKSWTFSLLFNYSTRGHSDNIYTYSKTQMHFGATKAFFKKKLQVDIWLIDIFNTKRNHNIIYSHNFMYDSNYKPSSRKMTVSLRLNINATRSKYKGKGAGNTEKNRL